MQLARLKTAGLQKFSPLVLPKKAFQPPQTSMIPENLSNNGTLAKELLASYPRLRNYKATVPLELGLISIVIGSFPSSIAMLGSGPLPLTSLSVMDFAAEKGQHGMRILNIDVVPERIRSSKKIFSLLGEKYKGVSHQVADAAGDDLADLSHCDAVYVASLIGNSDEDKIGVLRNTAARMRKGAVLVVRSSSGLSRLLWPVSFPQFKLLRFFYHVS
jgi:nicotianamine synthase